MQRTICLAACVSLSFGTIAARAEQPTKNYTVPTVAQASIVIDGQLNDSEWPKEAWENGFAFPWRQCKAPRTEMCCVCDGQSLLFAFRCDDLDLVLRGAVPEEEMTVAQGDRVELFFARDSRLNEYYCMEMSPAGTVLDYRASFYRKFDPSWDCPGLVLATNTFQDGYVLEGSIPLSTIREMCGKGLAKDTPILVGAYRAEYSHRKGEGPDEAWISWICPKAEEPDFHTPSSFGAFRLKD